MRQTSAGRGKIENESGIESKRIIYEQVWNRATKQLEVRVESEKFEELYD